MAGAKIGTNAGNAWAAKVLPRCSRRFTRHDQHNTQSNIMEPPAVMLSAAKKRPPQAVACQEEILRCAQNDSPGGSWKGDRVVETLCSGNYRPQDGAVGAEFVGKEDCVVCGVYEVDALLYVVYGDDELVTRGF